MDDYALKLSRRAEEVDAGSSNEGGKKWLKDRSLFGTLVSQGIEGVSELVRCELNHKGLPQEQEIIFVPAFHRTTPAIMSNASLVPGYVVKQNEDRRVVRLIGRVYRQAMVSVDKDMPVLSLRDRD